jgi:hypothetical protein
VPQVLRVTKDQKVTLVPKVTKVLKVILDPQPLKVLKDLHHKDLKVHKVPHQKE